MLLMGLMLAVSLPARAQDAASQPAQSTQPAAAVSGVDGGAGAIVPVGSPIEGIVFYVVGGAAALCALGCVLSANIVRMAVCLFGTLGSVAILYFLLAANFLGAIQLIVYAGGTLIVIIFGVMLTSKSLWARYLPKRAEIIAGAVVCIVLFLGLLAALRSTSWSSGTSAAGGFTVEQIGTQLLTTYLVPFELASVLLLAVMIGAAYLARTERR
jgi:NADH-quinone oxidoreductase subunit J